MIFGAKALKSQSAAKPAPYTMELTESMMDVKTSRSFDEYILRAQRGDGAIVTMASPYHPESVSQVRVIRFLPERRVVNLSDVTRTKSTFYLPEDVAQSVSDCSSPLGNAAWSTTGMDTFLNLPVRKFRKEEKMPDKTVLDEIWPSPSLGCAELYSKSEVITSDGLRARTERKATSVRLGEPDEVLFAIPADYEEVPPSEQTKRLMKHNGAKWRDSLQAGLDMQDHAYYTSQKNKPQ